MPGTRDVSYVIVSLYIFSRALESCLVCTFLPQVSLMFLFLIVHVEDA
jgi:hypothetical protein